MNSIFFTVAMLCQLNIQLYVGIEDVSQIERKQLECHKYYATCMKKTGIFTDWQLAQCVISKKN